MKDERGWHPTCGVAAVRDEHGEIVWESDLLHNALTDQGEASVLNVYLLEASNPSKYLAMLNQASAADPLDTDTIATITESKTPATGGYARQQVLNTDWGAPALVSSDYKSTGSAKVFGPFTGAAASVTHVALVTTLTGVTSPTTLLLLYIALGATLTVPIGQTFTYTPAVAAM